MNPTKANAAKFQHETASASDPIDAGLVTDFCKWLGIDATDENYTAAKRALEASRA